MIIGLLILIFAIAATTLSCFTFAVPAFWYEFYKPLFLFIGYYVGGVIVGAAIIEIVGKWLYKNKEKHSMAKFPLFLLKDGMRFIDNHAMCIVKQKGRNKLPKERFLYVCNHQGRFDPMIAYAYYAKCDIAFITKESNYKIPLAKHIMPMAHFQIIDREDPIQSLNVMRNSAELIKNNVCSIGVYPEGTRHKNGEIGDFHEGVFSIATMAKCPIVVGTIKGANKVKHNFPFKPTKINLDIVNVIYPTDYEGKTAKQISDEVKEMMINHLASI